METSANEVLQGLALTIPDDKNLRLFVITHPNSVIPEHARISSIKLPNLVESNEDGGVESALRSVLDERHFDVVLDQSECSAVPAVCNAHQTRCVRTVRLLSSHVAYQRGADYVDIAIHLSRFAQRQDTTHKKSILIRDYIGVPDFPKPDRRSTAVSVGRVSATKGHDRALKVCQNLGLELEIIGPLQDVAFANKLRRSGAKLAGAISRQDVLRTIQNSSCLIWLPRYPETNGRVVIEALRLGTPVIACKNGIGADISAKTPSLIRKEWDLGDERFETFTINSIPGFLPSSPEDVGREYWKVIYGNLACTS